MTHTGGGDGERTKAVACSSHAPEQETCNAHDKGKHAAEKERQGRQGHGMAHETAAPPHGAPGRLAAAVPSGASARGLTGAQAPAAHIPAKQASRSNMRDARGSRAQERPGRARKLRKLPPSCQLAAPRPLSAPCQRAVTHRTLATCSGAFTSRARVGHWHSASSLVPGAGRRWHGRAAGRRGPGGRGSRAC
jgi:hypothetical protein